MFLFIEGIPDFLKQALHLLSAANLNFQALLRCNSGLRLGDMTILYRLVIYRADDQSFQHSGLYSEKEIHAWGVT